MMTDIPKSQSAELLDSDLPPLDAAGPALRIDAALLQQQGACPDYGYRLLKRLGGPNGEIVGSWSPELALWLARQEPEAAEWLRATLGLGVAAPGRDLQGANLTRANLLGAMLKGAHLVGAYLWNANLEAANLENANLAQANLEGAVLWRANADNANLQEASLQQAHLEGAFLRTANLRGAVLWQASLRGAHLEGADLRDTLLQDVALHGAWRLHTDPEIAGWRVEDGRLRPDN
jgi:hypothetical protein